jgi:hypothetical protein
MQKIDNRVIAVNYSEKPIQLFVALANLCLPQKEDDPLAMPPRVLSDSRTIMQVYGECPMQAGCAVYFRLTKEGVVHVFDPEISASYQNYQDDPTEWSDEQVTDSFTFATMYDLQFKLRKALSYPEFA